MQVTEKARYQDVVEEIANLNWTTLTSDEVAGVACAYYFFSIQFRECLGAARTLYPDDVNLQHLEVEECDTDNLSPWPGVASIGEKMNHDEFMRRTLLLTPIAVDRAAFFEDAGKAYLAKTRAQDLEARALSIPSYEDGGLEAVFRAMLTCVHWNTPLLRAFEHFLVQHIRFDSNPDQGHGALSRHLVPDDRILPLWEAFRDLLVTCVPSLSA